jgi:lactobin A/cerein 7B family class IIb bacteriocin
MKMNTNMKELNLDEMEQVNGGIIGLVCVLGVVGGAIAMAIGIGYGLRDTDVEIHNGPFH